MILVFWLGRHPLEVFSSQPTDLSSSFLLLISVSVGPPTTTSTNTLEPALDIAAETVASSLTSSSEWERPENTTHMDASRLDSENWGFVSAVVHGNMIWDADGNRLRVRYNHGDDMLPVFSSPLSFHFMSSYHHCHFCGFCCQDVLFEENGTIFRHSPFFLFFKL